MRFIIFTLLGLGFLVLSCTPEQDTEEQPLIMEVNISLDSLGFQEVYDFIDHWQQDSLLPYLSHRDPSYRVLATYGFAGMMDEDYIDTVGAGIVDPVVEVRRATAYTLGQSYSAQAVPYLMKVFENQDSMGIDPLTFRFALEAVGKCADSSYLDLLAGITTYKPGDTLLLEGQCLGILNMAERGYSDDGATELMVRYSTEKVYASSVRLIAVNCLSAGIGQDLTGYSEDLKTAFEEEEDPNIRMFFARVMGKTGSRAVNWIRQTLRKEQDDRVRVELLRTSTDLPLGTRHRIWSGSLRDKNDLVAQTAADLIVDHGSAGYSQAYTDWAFSTYRPAVYARVLAAGNKYISDARFRQMVQSLIFQRIRATSDPYIRSDYIAAAGQRLSSARQLIGYDGDDVAPIIRTSIIEAIAHAVEGSGSVGSVEKNFLINRWKSGDVAALSILSPLFAEQKSLFPVITADEQLWTRQSENIPMPEGIEARIQVDQVRKKLFGFTYNPLFYRKPSWHTHDIDWTLYTQLSGQPRAEIQTSAGLMTIHLMKNNAPATVLNFIQLAESGYYDGKPIHRVVPNFVIQGGGNRGDGYGSLDYTIRSELGPQYYDQPGMVGMASAGPHTESQQWFITLRPTLHLDGRYTIFARLTGGEDVLSSVRRGDIIESIKIHR